VSTRAVRVAFGGEVMDVTDDLELQRLLREAHDEGAAVADLEDSLERLRRARAAQTALAVLPAEQLREALRMRRTALAGGRR
jgi:UDP-N-acetylmuramyl tripeptide synthase